MAAKTKCLAANNKRRTSAKPTNITSLHPGHPPPRSADRGRVSTNCNSAGAVPPQSAPLLGAQAMGSPSYGLDVVTLAIAVVLAAALVLLISHLMPLLADVMPPVLNGMGAVTFV